MPLVTGSRLGSYEIIGLLGAGGMGEVYRARDTSLKRDVAIKVLPASFSQDRDRLERFQSEAETTAALNHPNILSVFHIGQQDGSPYIVTELLEGEALAERLRRGPMRLHDVLDVAIAIARGLAAAHEKGIAHRDLKPENLFVAKDGHVKILDFGLAKLTPPQQAPVDNQTVTIRGQTNPGQVMGTAGYMSPEQVRGQPADARSDIFALGCVLFEMLTGKRAFQKPTTAETMSAILNEQPLDTSQIVPALPPAVQRVVHRCLEKAPERRFQSASDLAFALEGLSDPGSSPTGAATQRSARRGWIWIAIAATAVAIASVAALLLWWRVPSAVPIVEAVTQLTDDGEPKQGRLVSDGSRIYFTEGVTGSLKIAQVAVVGGPTAVIPTRFANLQIADIAPDGSALLALVGGYSDPAYPLWTIPLAAGEPRRLHSIEALDANFFPDGRLVFSRGSELYSAGKDGSDPHKLLSLSGVIWSPTVSPDGQRVVFTAQIHTLVESSLLEANADGSGLRTIAHSQDGPVCCPQWTPDGRYLVFLHRRRDGRAADVWLLPMRAGLFRRSGQPMELTRGGLLYSDPTLSRDGRQVFAIGTKRRGELVRYDTKSNQFLPILAGISAIDPSFSSDGRWVAYISYPDHTLWRSRADGTERLQLTYPPMQVMYPFISPDGKRVSFATIEGGIYVISMEGGTPQRISERESVSATWSADSNLLAVSVWMKGVRIYDLRSGKTSDLPNSKDLMGAQWLTQDTLAAAAQDTTRLMVFNFRTQKWSELVSGPVVNWARSPDMKYLYYTTGGPEPKALRIRLGDHKVEPITSLKNLRRVVDWEGSTQISVAPDGSAVFTRDIGTQEIYALTVRWH
jgi:WD40 repeat protein